MLKYINAINVKKDKLMGKIKKINAEIYQC